MKNETIMFYINNWTKYTHILKPVQKEGDLLGLGKLEEEGTSHFSFHHVFIVILYVCHGDRRYRRA